MTQETINRQDPLMNYKKWESSLQQAQQNNNAWLLTIINSFLYSIIASIWFSLLFVFLKYTGVLSCLYSFNKEFRYIRGITPLTSTRWVFGMICVYILSLPLLQYYMVNRKPIHLTKLMVIHNWFLMTASAVLSIGIAYFITKDIYQNGFYHSICSYESYDNPYLHLLYYLNYLLKFYEFFDTTFILLKKKKLIFLHWYHHAITALLTYIQQNDNTPVQWVPILMNLIVHVVMYAYYLLSALHIKVWWKQYLTGFQILQFVIDLIVCVYCTIQLYVQPVTCYGTPLAAYSGIGIIGSYFILFLKFYITNYKRKEKIE